MHLTSKCCLASRSAYWVILGTSFSRKCLKKFKHFRSYSNFIRNSKNIKLSQIWQGWNGTWLFKVSRNDDVSGRSFRGKVDFQIENYSKVNHNSASTLILCSLWESHQGSAKIQCWLGLDFLFYRKFLIYNIWLDFIKKRTLANRVGWQLCETKFNPNGLAGTFSKQNPIQMNWLEIIKT